MSGALILRPFLDAAEMKDGPACLAVPDSGVSANLVGADGTLVDSISNVFMNPSS